MTFARLLPFVLSGLAVLGGLALTPGAAEAQNPPPQQPGQQAPTELVFEREVFQYPAFQRRNPFAPLGGAQEGAPRFEQLRLMGILFSEAPGASVAVLGTSQVNIGAQGANVTVTPGGESWYLKAGQSIGNTRVVEIRREQVVVEVEEFGLTERRIMQLETRRQGGTP